MTKSTKLWWADSPRFFTVLFFGWMVVITFLSLVSGISVETDRLVDLPIDKLVHFTFYAVAVTLGGMAWKEKEVSFMINPRFLALLAFLASLYGTVIEVFQYSFTADRTAEWEDVLANSVGAIAGALFTLWRKDKIWTLKTRSK